MKTAKEINLRQLLAAAIPALRQRRSAPIRLWLICLVGSENKKLAWLLAQKSWIVPIPGSRKLERLDENIGAVNIELTANDLAEIDNAMSKITVQGDRY